MSEGGFGFVRCDKVRDVGMLRKAQSHALGLDKSSRKRRRDDAGPRASAFVMGADGRLRGSWTAERGKVSHLEEAFANFKASQGVATRGGSSLALHLIVGVSAGRLVDGGAGADNEDGKRLLAAAKKWAETEFGEGTVWAMRRDLDEAGAAVVDMFVSPHDLMGRKGKQRQTVSTKRGLAKVARKYGVPVAKSYSALQTSWAELAAEYWPGIQRGRSVEETGRVHVNADAVKDIQQAKAAAIEEAKAQVLAEERAAALADLEGMAATVVEFKLEANAIIDGVAAMLAEASERLGKR